MALLTVWAFLPLCALAANSESPRATAKSILGVTGFTGGLVVHVGCGDGQLTVALHAGDGYIVHGLDTEPEAVAKARQSIRGLGLYGKVSVDRLEGECLPYIDNLVNLIVVEEPTIIPRQEMMRVLCPQGIAYLRRGNQWTKIVKPWPNEIDEWTHYLHDASNNAVAHDTAIGPLRHLQWDAGPRYSRHQRDLYSPRPGIAHKRGNPKTTSYGIKGDTVIRCHRESTHREAKGWA
jgi:SAM-dependent methyltransferase